MHIDSPNRRPVVAVVHLGSNGGGPKFTFELTRALQDAGVLTLAVVAEGADNRADFEALGPTLALPTFTTSLGALLRAPLIVTNGLRMRRQLRRAGVQVVVVAMEQVWQAPILLLSGSRQRPQLLCVHDASMHPGDHNALEDLLRRAQRKLADGALTFSEHVAEQLRADRVFPADRIWRTVHGAYGATAAEPHDPPAPGTVPTVGFFGRLSTYKGLDLCYEAVSRLRAKGARLHLLVVGNGPKELVAGMRHPDDELRIGWVDDAEIASILREFSVLALPYRESSQSGVFAYALSQGLPAAVTPVGGLVEQANETGAAVIAEELSAPAFADALEQVLGDPSVYRSLARNGLAASTREHSWSRVGEDARAAVVALMDGERR